MKIVLLSDIHGFLPEIDKKSADLVFIVGDILPDYIIPHQYYWYKDEMVEWLKTVPPVVAVPGNHDFLFERFTPSEMTLLVNEDYVLSNGLRVYGFGYTICPGWAFHATEKKIKEVLTDETRFDILLSHNPPLGVLDKSRRGNCHTGSESILEWIGKVRPKFSVHGHIHEGYGSMVYKDTLCINCAFKDGDYDPRMKYLVIETDDLSIDVVSCKGWNHE